MNTKTELHCRLFFLGNPCFEESQKQMNHWETKGEKMCFKVDLSCILVCLTISAIELHILFRNLRL